LTRLLAVAVRAYLDQVWFLPFPVIGDTQTPASGNFCGTRPLPEMTTSRRDRPEEGSIPPSTTPPTGAGVTTGQDFLLLSVLHVQKEIGAQTVRIETIEDKYVAYLLFTTIAAVEEKVLNSRSGVDRKWILDTYAECMNAVRNPSGRASSVTRQRS
jgi:hypothetical protein